MQRKQRTLFSAAALLLAATLVAPTLAQEDELEPTLAVTVYNQGSALVRDRRQFTLSRELDTSRIEAQLRDGVLRLTIPKAEEARPRRIEVQVG